MIKTRSTSIWPLTIYRRQINGLTRDTQFMNSDRERYLIRVHSPNVKISPALPRSAHRALFSVLTKHISSTYSPSLDFYILLLTSHLPQRPPSGRPFPQNNHAAPHRTRNPHPLLETSRLHGPLHQEPHRPTIIRHLHLQFQQPLRHADGLPPRQPKQSLLLLRAPR